VPEPAGRRRSARAARSNGKADDRVIDASIDTSEASDLFVAQPETSDEPRAS